MKLEGDLVDTETRCVHYHSELDVVALRFKCCDTYYPCYQCHRGHPVVRYNTADLAHTKVVFCGVCKSELTFAEYAVGRCVHCSSRFNPGCKAHLHLYFDLESADVSV